MSAMQESVLPIRVPLANADYEVVVEQGALASVGSRLHQLLPACRKVALVTDSNVGPFHASQAVESLKSAGLDVCVFTIPAGEASKSIDQLLGLTQAFLENQVSRRDAVVALGGGVVGDLAGLAAGTFMRGIAFLQCPTSLLAQVDASVGGKVAVDLPAGKNLFGVFHFPRAVLIDPLVLNTLPDREIGCGLAEMVKHAALFDASHYEELVAAGQKIYDRDGATLRKLVATSVAHKARCVAQDPFEERRDATGRAALNLGHTFGHAIEHLSNFSVQHGEAVALGILAAARISARKGLASPELEARLRQDYASLRLPADLDAWLVPQHRSAIIQALARDKKRAASQILYIGLRDLGKPESLTLSAEEIFDLLC